MATVLVTGASSGIGAACVGRLDELGHRVFAGVRSDASAESVRARCSSRVEPLRLDVTDAGEVDAAAATVAERVGDAGLDGLVSNAGTAVGGPAEFLPLDEWRDQMEVNFFGPVALTQAFLPLVRSARGRLVYVSSVAGRVALPLGAPYGASKHAVEALAQSLRAELRPWGIGVSVVEPGAVGTAIWEKGASTAQRIRSVVGEEAVRLYGESIERLERQIAEIPSRAPGPEAAVAAIEHALFDTRPRPRYPAGTDARIVAVAERLLPDRALAWVVARSG